jgi:hypothetical protein
MKVMFFRGNALGGLKTTITAGTFGFKVSRLGHIVCVEKSLTSADLETSTTSAIARDSSRPNS